jgi:arylsulfatase
MYHSRRLSVTVLVVFVALTMTVELAFAANKPNIVLVFLDNFGWGEPGFNGGGIIRGAETPRMDTLASEGLRLTNFNVEVQCTPSRSAIMTGRYAIRSGNGTVPLGEGVYGLVQWEVTMAEMLSEAGYATGMYGREMASRPNRGPIPDRSGVRRVVWNSQFHGRVNILLLARFLAERGP